jgi:L-asparagine transporter-like permease
MALINFLLINLLLNINSVKTYNNLIFFFSATRVIELLILTAVVFEVWGFHSQSCYNS